MPGIDSNAIYWEAKNTELKKFIENSFFNFSVNECSGGGSTGRAAAVGSDDASSILLRVRHFSFCLSQVQLCWLYEKNIDA